MSIENFYSVGLHNVGSYQVSGAPWLKTFNGLTSNTQETIIFPNVPKSIKVKNTSLSGQLKISFASFLSSQKTSALNFNSNGPDYSASVSPTVTGNKTISLWINTVALGVAFNYVFYQNFNNQIRMNKDISGVVTISPRINGILGPNINAGTFINNEWIHIVMTSNTIPRTEFYVNGVSKGFMAATFVDFGSFFIPTTTSGVANYYLGPYDEFTIWDKDLNGSEVLELYNTGDYYNPTTHSAASVLKVWWAFESNSNIASTYSSDGPDTITTIYDRIGASNLSQAGAGTNSSTFIEAQQGWEVSAPNNVYSNHSITLTAGQEFIFNCKAKQIFVYADGASQNFQVEVSMTNIPSSRMYTLQGEGIDE